MRKQGLCFAVHARFLGGRFFVVIAEQMQNAVNEQFGEAFFKSDAGGLGLAQARLDGYDHIAQQMRAQFCKFTLLHGEGNHIGGSRAAQILMVQGRDAVIVDHQQGKLGLRRCQGV